MYRIIRGGCGSKHIGTFSMSRPEGLPFYVLLNVRSQGEFLIGEKTYHVAPGTVMLISPTTPYAYSNPAGNYMDDWLHFAIDNPEEFETTFPHTNIPIPGGSGEIYTTLLHQLLWEHAYTPAPYAEKNIDHLFEIILNHLHSTFTHAASECRSTPYSDRLRAIRLNIQSAPMDAPDISTCASELGISVSYFQHIYTRHFGISYQKDVIHFRIEHAKNLLLTTSLSMEQIAELSGYNNPVHFYRQFKKKAGETPARFRNYL